MIFILGIIPYFVIVMKKMKQKERKGNGKEKHMGNL